MKRYISLILALVLLLQLMPLHPLAAEPPLADNTPEEIEIMQQAIVEMARSYLRRSEDIRYDWENLTVQERYSRGITRITSDDPLGSAAPDNLLYTNCAQFTYTVYKETFGYGPNNSTSRTAKVMNYHTNMTVNDPEMVLRFGGDGMTDRTAFSKKLQEVLQPGDIVNSLIVSSNTNHSMLYVGDILGDGGHYVIHSSGSPSGHLGDSGVETMRLGTWDLFLGSGTFGILNTDNDSFTVLRPINVIDYDRLTPSALSRLQYPGVDICRTANVHAYRDVEQGQQITVTLSLHNSGTSTVTGLTVTDPAPAGAAIDASSISHGGILQNGGAVWHLDIPAGERLLLTYTVTVTASLGQTVTLAAGTVDRIPTRDLSWHVGGKPLDEEALMQLITHKKVQGLETGTNTMELDFANRLLRSTLGIELGLPKTANQLIAGILNQVQAEKNGTGSTVTMLQPKKRGSMTAQYRAIYDMILPDHLTGRMIHLGFDQESMYPRDRVITYFADSYQPGDVFLLVRGSQSVTARTENVTVAVHLGQGLMAVPRSDGRGFAIRTFDEVVPDCLDANLVLVLRPSHNLADAAAALAADPSLVVPPALPDVPVTPDGQAIAVVENGGLTAEVVSLNGLFSAISPTGLTKVTLLGDISTDSPLHLPYSCTVDLNGFTIATNPNKDNGVVIDKAGSVNPVTTLKNGKTRTHTVGVRVTEGAIVISGLDMESYSGTCVGIYDPNPAYKDLNLIENSVLTSAAWGAVVFNGDGVDCSKTGITIRNSVLVAHKSAGSYVLDYRSSGKPGTVTLGIGVEIYTYKTSYSNSKITKDGLSVKKASGTHNITVAGRTYIGLYCWTTADTCTNHTWDSGTVIRPSLCLTPGERRFTCRTCGTGKTETIPAPGYHSWSGWTAAPAGHSRICTACLEEEHLSHTWNGGTCSTCSQPIRGVTQEDSRLLVWLYDLPAGALIFAAGFDTHGRMLGLSQGIRAEDPCLTLPLPAGKNWQIFLLDSSCIPVGEPLWAEAEP